MNYFYDTNQKAFLVEGIHTIPSNAIAVTEEQHKQFVDGLATGKVIYIKNGELKLTPVKPSPFHEWDGSKWVITAEKQAEQLKHQKDLLIGLVANIADEMKSQILVGYPQAEIDSFFRQEREARAWVEDNQSLTPMLSGIAERRGVSLEILVQKVIEKADQFAVIMGQIIGTRQKFEDCILAAKTMTELTACEQEIEQWQLAKN